MAYPNTSDFTSGVDRAAWYQIRGANGELIVCSTSGRAFVNALQSLLGVTVDGRWGSATSTAVLQMIQALQANPALISGVQAELSLRRVGPLSVRAGVWLNHQLASIGDAPLGVAVTDINIPDGTITPVWAVAAPQAPSGNAPVQCVIVNGATAPPSPVPEPPVTTVPGMIDTTSNDVALPPGVSTLPVSQQGASAPTGLVIAVVAGVLIVGALAFNVSRKPAPRVRRKSVAR